MEAKKEATDAKKKYIKDIRLVESSKNKTDGQRNVNNHNGKRQKEDAKKKKLTNFLTVFYFCISMQNQINDEEGINVGVVSDNFTNVCYHFVLVH